MEEQSTVRCNPSSTFIQELLSYDWKYSLSKNIYLEYRNMKKASFGSFPQINILPHWNVIYINDFNQEFFPIIQEIIESLGIRIDFISPSQPYCSPVKSCCLKVGIMKDSIEILIEKSSQIREKLELFTVE